MTYRRVTLLRLLRVAGEDDKLRLVCLEALHVQFLALLAQVPPAVVDYDAYTTCLLLANARLLELGQGESTALADLGVVADGLSTDSRAKQLERTDTERGSLSLAGTAAAELASGLVEPGADAALPVLAEVVVVEDVVMLETHVCAEERDQLALLEFTFKMPYPKSKSSIQRFPTNSTIPPCIITVHSIPRTLIKTSKAR